MKLINSFQTIFIRFKKITKGKMIIGHRPTQTDTDISVPRLAGLKESSRSRVKNSHIWSLPKGSTFCFAIVGKAKSLCASRERSERVVNKP